jgi:transposase
MKEKLRFLGMDVHAETIATAIAEPDGEVRSLGTIPNRMDGTQAIEEAWPSGEAAGLL